MAVEVCGDAQVPSAAEVEVERDADLFRSQTVAQVGVSQDALKDGLRDLGADLVWGRRDALEDLIAG